MGDTGAELLRTRTLLLAALGALALLVAVLA